MADTLKKFGKFFLLDQIAQGGMAEIYRARMATLDGGGRLLAVKRIIASYSQNPEFVTMFKAEIKTTSGFTHPNIVQLYDYGEEEGMLYIAMEIVDGKNLRQFMGRFSELKQTFPVEVCVYIMEQAAHGMGYAHSYKDKFSGKNLNIVHRDISPQNLLISYDGAVKVIDFGIAKAATNVESTRAGVIKGKPSYLSPEQISGEVLDGRSDIFALGIVLWELLTGKKLFASDNDYAVLKLIENCTNHVKPPSMYNPKVPKELDAIVMKSLQKNRDTRYQTAEELQRALHKFLYQFAPEFNPADLAYYARDLFKNEIVEDRKRLLKLNERVEQLLSAESASALKVESTTTLEPGDKTDPGVPEAPPPTKAIATPGKAGLPPAKNTGSFRMVELAATKEKTNVTLDFGPGGKPAPVAKATGFAQATSQTRSISRSTTGTATKLGAPEKSGASKSPMAAIFLVAALGAGYWYYSQSTGRELAGKQAPTEVAQLAIHGNPKAVTITIDGKAVGGALPAQLAAVPANRPVKVVVSANGYRKFTQEMTLTPGEAKSLNVNLAREDGSVDPNVQSGSSGVSSKTFVLKLNVEPPGVGTSVRLNGSAVDYGGVISAKSDTPLDLVVERDGFRTVHRNFTVDGAKLGERAEHSVDIQLEPAKFGYVSIKTTPSADALVQIDGMEEKWQTPVSRKRVPVGVYKVKLVNSLLGMEREITITVNEDRFTNVEERLSVEGAERTPGSH